jgi:decaprenylphospho-beta-D-erythro-pentofuranosid-2-ulose 2-reductase
MKRRLEQVVIFGATSAIAAGTARSLARQGARLALCARNSGRLEELAGELRGLGAAQVDCFPMEARDRRSLEFACQAAFERLGRIDGVLIAQGVLSDQQACDASVEALLEAIEVNGTSALYLAHRAAQQLEQQAAGCLAFIGSGAGVRGRRSTHAYGAAKALVQVYLEGVRARLHRCGVGVLTVFPCFVDSPMTAYLPKRLRFVDPDLAGQRIHQAMLQQRDLLYIPRWWRLALCLARNAPEFLVKRSRSEERFAAGLKTRQAGPSEQGQDPPGPSSGLVE